MKKYNIIYADPAWDIEYVVGGKYQGTIAGAKKLPYQTMTDEAIMALPIKNIAADDAVLFLWVVDSKFEIMFDIMRAWGFNFVCNAFVWRKMCKTKGKTHLDFVTNRLTPTARSCEFCFMGVRGKPQKFINQNKLLTNQKRPLQVIDESLDYKLLANQIPDIILPDNLIEWAKPTKQHSLKPPETRDRIVQLLGDLPRVELFARQVVEGWDCWGNEVSNSITL